MNHLLCFSRQTKYFQLIYSDRGQVLYDVHFILFFIKFQPNRIVKLQVIFIFSPAPLARVNRKRVGSILAYPI